MKNTTTDIYEAAYKDKNRFSFGQNWQEFIKTAFNQERAAIARRSLSDFLGGKDKIKGKTFIDIGCGSGLFSLAAYKLGAAKVVSVDVDDFSVACTKSLHEREAKPRHWTIVKGSALDKRFIASLGQFDIVYSWGVLHHTGDMYKAFDNINSLLKPGGVLYLAIYNRSRSWRIGTSNFWLKVKKAYNRSGKLGKLIITGLYVGYFFLDSAVLLKNPFQRMKSFKRRGMNWYHNVVDWLGGYPYQYAAPDEIINYFASKSIYCEKINNAYGLGCVEYLLRRAAKS